MSRVLIADAITHLEDLLQALTNAYWETSEIHRKDCVFDLVTVIYGELNELAKLSYADHEMTYEPITAAFHNSETNLRTIRNNIDTWFPRNATAAQLQRSIPPVNALFEFV
ncbi:hypothetical protein WKI13_11730 [Teredinibacter turnerae]|uniref:hypothetical protein n=1 Tax=Teredinibacter turnerae TaxID=2426 RepID=UPI000376BAC5|nr:hypothetical protein [Teredinibacter turnerae]